jgi:hypothetical protein
MPLTTYTAGEVLTAASLNANFSFAAGAGAVAQVKSTTKSDTFTMSSSTFADVTGLSVTITPTSASNKILVCATITAGNDGTGGIWTGRLLRDSTTIAVGDTAGSRKLVTQSTFTNSSGATQSAAIMFLDSPATTSAITYKIQIAGTGVYLVAVNRTNTDTDNNTFPRGISTITVLEVTP